jgi:CheY-like chemotaxis protein
MQSTAYLLLGKWGRRLVEMAVQKIVLVVSPTPSMAHAVASSVRQCGYTALVVRSFGEAKKHLELRPHLVITELKLAEYNGLHLALRAQISEAPAIVIADPTFEHEVEQNGAIWMSPVMAATDDLQPVLTRLLQGPIASDATFIWQDAEATTLETQLSKWLPPNPPILQ